MKGFPSICTKIWKGSCPSDPSSDAPKQWLARLKMEVEEDGDSQKTENEKGGAF